MPASPVSESSPLPSFRFLQYRRGTAVAHRMTQLLGSNAQGSRPAPYKLSAILTGHSSDVRSICTASLSSSNRLSSASRDGTARSWVRGGSGDWAEERVYRDGHEGYVNAVCFVAPEEAGGDDHGLPSSAACTLRAPPLSTRRCRPPRYCRNRRRHPALLALAYFTVSHHSLARPSRPRRQCMRSTRFSGRTASCERKLGLDGEGLGLARRCRRRGYGRVAMRACARGPRGCSVGRHATGE